MGDGMDETEQQERERKFAEYDASVQGSVTPDGLDELIEKLKAAVTFDYQSGGDGYEKSADAMWRAALAAFNWAADVVGATGFQASWAALRFYGEAMHVDGPFMVVQLRDALYPQYDLPGRVQEAIDEHRGWLAEQAGQLLAENGYAHPNVVAHWQKLVAAVSS